MMKWKNKGHEFDEWGEQLAASFRKSAKIYIFGAGLLGGEMRPVLERYGVFAGFIDNDKEKQSAGADGASVISLESYLELGDDGWIVICADQRNRPAIEEQLDTQGLEKDKNYFVYDYFMRTILPVVSTYYFDKTFVELAQISLTERCTLRCEKCAHACYAVSRTAKDMELEQVYKSADAFFEKVDIIKEFVLIGGEPFLYREIGKAIEYIGNKYRSRMLIFSITTNGTILPGEDILELCKRYGVLIRISNYSVQIPRLQRKYEELVRLLSAKKIEHRLGKPEWDWLDYGFESVKRCAGEEELIQVFDACKIPCREVRGERYYFCVMARCVSDNLQYHVGEEDYLDLGSLTGEDSKRVFLEFGQGYSEKGYLDMCDRCRGAEAYYYPIPAAKQKVIIRSPAKSEVL